MIHSDHLRIDSAYRKRLRACGLDTVERILTSVDGRVAAWSRTTDTLHVPGADDMPGFYVKRHFFPSWAKRLRGTFRGTFFGKHRGHAECLTLNALRDLGIPAVRPVAYGARRVGHFLAACFLITEEVPQAVNLTSFAQEVVSGSRRLSRGQRAALLERLALQLARMHAAGLSHGNLFWRNVLVRDGVDGRPEFFFLDVQPLPLRERLRAGRKWWRHELAQTLVSALPFSTRAERLRFFLRYLGAKSLSPERKADARAIARLADSWRHHELRRIRMNHLFEEWNRQMEREQRPDAPSEGMAAGRGARG